MIKYLTWLVFAIIVLGVTSMQASSTSDNSLEAIPKNAYPVRMGYIDRINEWFPVAKLAAGLGVPGYTDEKIYNYVSLGFWKCGDVPMDAALVWSKPVDYFGDDSVFGKTQTEIQQSLRKKYNDGKV